jgi:hypothetical protein
MFDSWNQSRRATAAKVLVALISATGCLAAVAYAASAPSAPHRNVVAARAAAGPAKAAPRPPRPRITAHPTKTTLSTRVIFRHSSRLAGGEFECKLDGGEWRRCGPQVSYRGLAVGPHLFLVRVGNEAGARSRPTRFSWVQAQPRSFSIAAELAALSQLYPGAPPVAVPLVLTNPNSAPIAVTALRVGVAADPAACPSAENLELIPSSASKAAPLTIPAGGSVRLPAAGVSSPAIALRDLPVNQDGCQGAQFPLTFSGEAHG